MVECVVCRMWSCERSKINQNQPCHFETLKCDPSRLWRVSFQSFGFIFSACFWKPHDNPHPTSVSATVRSKSLRTTATWTVIKPLIMVICMEIVEVSATTASPKWSEGSWWHLQMACLRYFGWFRCFRSIYQHPKYVCFARIAGCHLRQLSTTDRGISLVEAITQGVLRGMEALLQWSSFSARLLGTTLACHSYSLYISPCGHVVPVLCGGEVLVGEVNATVQGIDGLIESQWTDLRNITRRKLSRSLI